MILYRLYYTTEKSAAYNDNNSFFSHYYENEDLDIYIPLSKEVLLTNLMIVPATNEGSNIIIKSLEIREINNTNKFSSNLLTHYLTRSPHLEISSCVKNCYISINFELEFNNIWMHCYDH